MRSTFGCSKALDRRALTGMPAAMMSRSLMRLARTRELQARAMGGLSRKTSKKLDQLVAGGNLSVRSAPQFPPFSSPSSHAES
jgi:hypothetical protein